MTNQTRRRWRSPQALIVALLTIICDLWVLGNHRPICGDSTNPADVDRVLEGVKPHLLISDPPCGVSYDSSWRSRFSEGDGQLATGKVMNDDRANWREA